MAGRGPAPKDASERRRRNQPATPVVTVEPDGNLHGPDLPDGFEWPEATRAWWEIWRRSAQAQTFTDTDWSFLVDTAVLHAEFWLGNRALAPELRLRVAKFGASPEDRARLRMEVGTPAAPRDAVQKKVERPDRRQRLLKAVGDVDGT